MQILSIPQLSLFNVLPILAAVLFVCSCTAQSNDDLVLPVSFHTAPTEWSQEVEAVFSDVLVNSKGGNGDFLNRLLTSEQCGNFTFPFCPAVLASDSNLEAARATVLRFSRRSAGNVAPWIIVRNFNHLRYPSDILEACCACAGSCGIPIGHRDFQHRPVKSNMLVSIKDNSTATPRWELQEFTVGCTCSEV